MITLAHVSKIFAGGTRALRDVSLTVTPPTSISPSRCG
jgi:hypothetical protein